MALEDICICFHLCFTLIISMEGKWWRVEFEVFFYLDQVFTIEPMLVEGKKDVFTWEDGWTVATVDHGRCAQFEHTIVIHRDGAEILTCSFCSTNNWVFMVVMMVMVMPLLSFCFFIWWRATGNCREKHHVWPIDSQFLNNLSFVFSLFRCKFKRLFYHPILFLCFIFILDRFGLLSLVSSFVVLALPSLAISTVRAVNSSTLFFKTIQIPSNRPTLLFFLCVKKSIDNYPSLIMTIYSIYDLEEKEHTSLDDDSQNLCLPSPDYIDSRE